MLLFFFTALFAFHIAACLFIIIGKLNEGDDDWISENGYKGIPKEELYLVSFYWIIQTISTVGYGDTSLMNHLERIFCIIIMIVGVIGFSFATGSLASII